LRFCWWEKRTITDPLKSGAMEEMAEPEEQGIACALGKICYLESRLRDAIQSTHSLTRSYGRDSQAVDRERAALLVIRFACHVKGMKVLAMIRFEDSAVDTLPLSSVVLLTVP